MITYVYCIYNKENCWNIHFFYFWVIRKAFMAWRIQAIESYTKSWLPMWIWSKEPPIAELDHSLNEAGRTGLRSGRHPIFSCWFWYFTNETGYWTNKRWVF